MRIVIVSPAPPGSRHGNRTTALRWSRILQSLGHRVQQLTVYLGGGPDALIALHAKRSYASIQKFHNDFPDRPSIVTLTGTDLYRDLANSEEANRSLEWATRIVALQRCAFDSLPAHLHPRLRIIEQSATRTQSRPKPLTSCFEICVIAHLRDVKDPLRAAEAARLLPPESRIQITHIGGVIQLELEKRARDEMKENRRYVWRGERSHSETMRFLARSRLLVLTSVMEGGANVVSEALALGIPVISSRIPGSIGLLGEDYPGYFEVGDTPSLAKLISRAETDGKYYVDLVARCKKLQPMVSPDRERRLWDALIQELSPPKSTKHST
jgi:putative glycosyltransferase (TIGR04348 family)